MKRLCRRLARQRGVRAADVAIPVETGPGEVAQVDFGYVGRLLCPDAHVLRHAWVFVMVLGYSRHLFAEVVFDQKATTWLQLHRRAFEAFGGVVQTLVPDNLKAAVNASLLVAAQSAAILFVSVAMGPLADALPRRSLLIGADIVAALMSLTVVAAALSFWPHLRDPGDSRRVAGRHRLLVPLLHRHLPG